MRDGAPIQSMIDYLPYYSRITGAECGGDDSASYEIQVEFECRLSMGFSRIPIGKMTAEFGNLSKHNAGRL